MSLVLRRHLFRGTVRNPFVLSSIFRPTTLSGEKRNDSSAEQVLPKYGRILFRRNNEGLRKRYHRGVQRLTDFTLSREGRQNASDDLAVSPWNVANAVTLGRIVAAPLTGYWILQEQYDLALGGLLYAGASDWLDGFLARRFRLRTVLGSYLDPAADKLLITTSTICLAYQHVIPPWLAALIVGRDAILVAGWSILLGEKAGSFSPVRVYHAGGTYAIQPVFISKLNTAMQISLSFAAVVSAGNWAIIGEPVVHGLGLATALTTTGSGLSYGLQFARRRKGVPG